MRFRRHYYLLLIVLLFSLALAACGGEEPVPTEVEEVIPTEKPESEEILGPDDSSGDSDTSSDPVIAGNTQVTEIEQIVGTWIAPAYPGNFVLTVFPDGKLSVATSLADLERGSTNSWDLTIEGGQITATNFALCLGDIGSYIGEVDPTGNLRFVSIIDACEARLRMMDRSLPGRLHEYKLVFRPVE
jgi:hypothetical protein